MTRMYDNCLQGLVPRKRSWWLIHITGYGPFEYYGTDLEADDALRAKAEWEGGSGRKRPATPDEAQEGRDFIEWQMSKGYGLSDRELEALKE